MGKPAGVLYIDDKAARVNSDDKDGWLSVWDEVGKLKGRDKYGNFSQDQLTYWEGFVS